MNKSEAIQSAEAAVIDGVQAEQVGSEGPGSTDGTGGTHETLQEEPIRVTAAVAALLVRLSSDAAQVETPPPSLPRHPWSPSLRDEPRPFP